MNRLLAPSNYLFKGDEDTRFWEGGGGGGGGGYERLLLRCVNLLLWFGLVAAPKEGVLLTLSWHCQAFARPLLADLELVLIDWLIDWLNSHIISWCQKSKPWSQSRKTPFGRKERTTYSIYKKGKADNMVQKILGKSDISKKRKRSTCGYLHIEGRLNEGPRLQRKHKDENEPKQNKRNTRERRHDICKPNDARRAQVRATYGWLVNKGERTSTSPLACFGQSSCWSLYIRWHHSRILLLPSQLCTTAVFKEKSERA